MCVYVSLSNSLSSPFIVLSPSLFVPTPNSYLPLHPLAILSKDNSNGFYALKQVKNKTKQTKQQTKNNNNNKKQKPSRFGNLWEECYRRSKLGQNGKLGKLNNSTSTFESGRISPNPYRTFLRFCLQTIVAARFSLSLVSGYMALFEMFSLKISSVWIVLNNKTLHTNRLPGFSQRSVFRFVCAFLVGENYPRRNT